MNATPKWVKPLSHWRRRGPSGDLAKHRTYKLAHSLYSGYTGPNLPTASLTVLWYSSWFFFWLGGGFYFQLPSYPAFVDGKKKLKRWNRKRDTDKKEGLVIQLRYDNVIISLLPGGCPSRRIFCKMGARPNFCNYFLETRFRQYPCTSLLQEGTAFEVRNFLEFLKWRTFVELKKLGQHFFFFIRKRQTEEGNSNPLKHFLFFSPPLFPK